jgi:hypothetical protein
MARWVNVTWASVAWASDFVGGEGLQVRWTGQSSRGLWGWLEEFALGYHVVPGGETLVTVRWDQVKPRS